MKQYEIVREERKYLSEDGCPVDLMGEAEDEDVIFTLSSEAYRRMCAFPVKKEVTYFVPFGDTQSVGVVWPSDDPTEYTTSDWMEMSTGDRCKTYFVERANTEEIVYKCPSEGARVVNYIIE